MVSVFYSAVFIKLGSLKEPCYIIMLTMSNFGFNYSTPMLNFFPAWVYFSFRINWLNYI